MWFVADAEDAVVLRKREQHFKEIFRRGVGSQSGTRLGLLGKAQCFFGNIGGLSGPEVRAAEEERRGHAEPNKAFCGFSGFLNTLVGQGTSLIVLGPLSPINGHAMSK